MRRLLLLPIVMTLGFLPAVFWTGTANATMPAALLSAAGKESPAPSHITKVWYGGWGYGWRRPYWGGYGWRPYWGGYYAYGWRRPYWGGYYGYARPYYGSWYGGYGCW